MKHHILISTLMLATLGLTACNNKPAIPAAWNQDEGVYKSKLYQGIDARVYHFYGQDEASEKFFRNIQHHRQEDLLSYVQPKDSVMRDNYDAYVRWYGDRKLLTEEVWAGAEIMAPEATADAMLAYMDETMAIEQHPNTPIEDGDITTSASSASTRLHTALDAIEHIRTQHTLGSVIPIQYPVSGGDLNQEQAYMIHSMVQAIRTGDVYHTVLLQGTEKEELYLRRAEDLKNKLSAMGIPRDRIKVDITPNTPSEARDTILHDTDLTTRTIWVRIHPHAQDTTHHTHRATHAPVPVF